MKVKRNITKVTLRRRKINDGRQESLYLDFYPPITNLKTGRPTRRQSLGIYLNPPTIKMKAGKEICVYSKTDENQIRMAELICAKKQNELQKVEIYSHDEKYRLEQLEKGKENFVDFFYKLVCTKANSNQGVWLSAYKCFRKYAGDFMAFNKITLEYCEDYRNAVLKSQSLRHPAKKLSDNTKYSYFSKFRAVLKEAFKHGYLMENFNEKLDALKEADTSREFLTEEELNKLSVTTCKEDTIRRAALFSALTGLRFSDIAALRWSNIRKNDKGEYYLFFQIEKTDKYDLHPICQQALDLCGKLRNTDEKVFTELKYSGTLKSVLQAWMTAAGITKHITFHCFRHTYATTLITKGVDIYTVSKMLGHKDVKTTQRYAHLLDESKRNAANKLHIQTNKTNNDGISVSF